MDFITGEKTRDGAGAQVIAEGKKPPGRIMASQFARFFGLVPDEFDRLPQNVADGVKNASWSQLDPGKTTTPNFHAVAAPCNMREHPF